MATQTIPVTNANWFFSPYNWYSDGAGALASTNVKASSTYAQSNTPGAYCKTAFSGATAALKLNVDVSPLTAASVAAARYPVIAYSVDGAAFTRYQLQSTDTQITLASSLGSGAHTLEVWFVAVSYSSNDRWSAPVMVVRATGLELDSTVTMTAPTLRTKRIVLFGNSNTEGHERLAATVSEDHQDARLTFGDLLAKRLDAEIGIIGFAAQGIDTANYVPALTDTWNLYSAAKSRLFSSRLSPVPAAIIFNEGINDSGDVTISTTALIAAGRAAAPLSPQFVLVPWNGAKAAQLAAGVVAAADLNAYFINTGVTSYATNGTHLSTAGHSSYEADFGPSIAATLVSINTSARIVIQHE